MASEHHAGESLGRPRRLAYIFVLGALAALGALTVDLYLPAFPAIAEEFRTSPSAVQLTLAVTSIGFGLGQLIVGPWSDRAGRRLPLILGASLHVVASLAVSVAPTIEAVTVLRALQGIGAAAGGVVAMALVRDLYGGRPLVRMLGHLALINGLAPVFGPVIGAQLLHVLDWRGLFVILAGYGAAVLLAICVLITETLPRDIRAVRAHVSTRDRFAVLVRDRRFVGTALMSGMLFSALISYVASSPFILQERFGVDAAEFGALFAVNAVGLVIAAQISSRVARRIGPQWVLAVSVPLLLVAGGLLIVLAPVGGGIGAVTVPFFLIAVACGASSPCVQVMALAEHPREAGTAASLTGVSNAVLGGVISLVPGWIGLGSGVSVGIVVSGVAAVALVLLWAVVRPRSVPRLSG